MCNPEVGDDDAPVFPHQHVVGLEVAVHHAGCMRRAHAAAHLLHDVHDLRQREPPSSQRQARERLSVDELHRQELFALVLSNVERASHVAVGHPTRKLRLLPEPRQHRRRFDQLAL